jgi:hypothetical protein
LKVKKTELLAAEVRQIAFGLPDVRRKLLLEAADRLEETNKIAEFYREEAVKNGRNKAN